jgi:hypothetical protein
MQELTRDCYTGCKIIGNDVSEYQIFNNRYHRNDQKFFIMTFHQQQTHTHASSSQCVQFSLVQTYQHRFHFLLYNKQLASAARHWVQFCIWIGFSLYEFHVVLSRQNSSVATINFNNFCDFTNTSRTEFCSTSL